MIFKNPLFLLLLPVFGVLLWLKLRQPGAALRYSLGSFLSGRIREPFIKKHFFTLLRSLAVILLIIALARPVRGLKERSVSRPAADIMMVMDVSISMKAIDFEPLNRMEAAVRAAKKFVQARTSDRIGIVVFSGLPVLQCPLTMDNSAVLRLVDRIEAGMVEAGGTAIGMGIALGLRYLERADSPGKVMILLSDGANNTGDIDPATAAEMARALGIRIHTIGCGVPGPARIPYDHPVFGRRYHTIPDEIDEDELRNIAEVTGGRYFRADSLKSLNEIYAEIDRLERVEVTVTEHYEFEEKFKIFLAAGLLLLGAELAVRTFRRGISL